MSAPNCDWQHELAPTWRCIRVLGHTGDHLMFPLVSERHTFCPRCGSGPLVNDPHFDGEACGDCGRPFTPAEKERMG